MQTFNANPADWSDNELNWLKPFSESKIVALGEAVHTSDGFYSAKARIIKYLIENHNYRAISFESPWGKALSATRFIQEGQGTVEDALKGLFRVWRAKSVENLLLWLRQWNIDHPQDQVRFFGNDSQQPDWDLELLLNSPLISSDEKNELKRLVSSTFDKSIFHERYGASEEFKKLMAEGFAENQDQTSEIMELLGQWSFPNNSLEYVALVSLSASVLGLSKDIHGTAKDIVQLRGESFAHRDKCMSDLTLHFAGTDKTILWAHNIHISRPNEKLAEGLYYQGQFLRKSLQDQYQAIALTASKIETNWPWLPSHMRGPILPEDSLEKALANQFPNQSLFLTNIGNIKCANYSESFNFNEDGDISARFDGLIVLPESAPIEYAIAP